MDVEARAGLEITGCAVLLHTGGDLHWVTPADENATVNAAHQHGVAVSPGRSYFPAEPPGPYLRLSYAAAAPAILLDAVTRLSQAIHQTAGHSIDR